MTGVRRDGRPGWDPEGDAEYIAGLLEHIPTVEDDYERWGWEEFLALCRARTAPALRQALAGGNT